MTIDIDATLITAHSEKQKAAGNLSARTAQLSFTDHDGYRFQAILTNQVDQEIAVVERRHRRRARVEDRIRDDKGTGPAKFPFKELALNEVWLEIVGLAHT